MAEKSGTGASKKASASSGPLDQHPLVSGLRYDPAAALTPVVELVGFPGNSDRSGYQRLYLRSTLDYYAEFLLDDLLYSATVPPESSPFPGHEAVIVSIRRDAQVDYTWTRKADDDFDLDVRLEAATYRDAEMLEMSGFTSCTGCSLGLSCTYCPTQHHCPSHHGHCPH